MKARVPNDFEEAVALVREALADAGFGILTEIDVQAKMKERLDRDMPPYLILGACAPPLAWQALQAEPDAGVLLPCNVCVYREGGNVTVSAMDPAAAMRLIDNEAVARVAKEAHGRLERVLSRVAGRPQVSFGPTPQRP